MVFFKRPGIEIYSGSFCVILKSALYLYGIMKNKRNTVHYAESWYDERKVICDKFIYFGFSEECYYEKVGNTGGWDLNQHYFITKKLLPGSKKEIKTDISRHLR